MIVYFTLTAVVLALLLLVKKNTVSECADCGRVGLYRGMTRQDVINAIVLAAIFLGLFDIVLAFINLLPP